MKINFSAVLCLLNGDAIQYQDRGDVRPMELRDASIEALMSTSNSLPDGETKFRAYQLASRLQVGGEVDLTPEEAVTIREKIGVAYGANVVGPAYLLLNG